MRVSIKNRPLSWAEKQNLDENELKVITCYEKMTKQRFMRFDLKILNRLIKIATPEQINSQIIRFSKNYKTAEKFTFFGYVEPPVKNMFVNRRGGNGSGNKG